MPPSRETNQYPRPVGVAAMPTIGWFRWRRPVPPRNFASPEVMTPPSAPTRQAPKPLGVAAIETTGARSGSARIDAEGITRGLLCAAASSISRVVGFGAAEGVRADA